MSIYDPLSIALGINPIENPTYLIPFSKEEKLSLGLVPIPGPKHCEDTRLQISESNKAYYQTEKGIERRKNISERNSLVKSEEMKKRWKENYEFCLKNVRLGGRKKGSLDKGMRQRKNNIRLISDGKQVFKDAYEAALYYNIHPVNIRRKCRKQIDDWRYV
jgi:hypothetical protein